MRSAQDVHLQPRYDRIRMRLAEPQAGLTDECYAILDKGSASLVLRYDVYAHLTPVLAIPLNVTWLS